ncbi:MAG: TonB-dependent receptor [Sphingomonas bacterium]|nr:TonB-dependent receptor [Sphingomonas bacterium]
MKNDRSRLRWQRAIVAASASLCALAVPALAQAQSEQKREDPHPADSADSANATRPDVLVIGQRDVLRMPSATGSRLDLTPLETPASIAVLEGDQIRARGDLSIVDAVTRAPGITSAANPGNGGTALAARGFSGQGSVLQLTDGIRLFPVAGTITAPSDPWNVDRIEVLSGPASVLYGQGALGGAINVVTKKPNADRTEMEAEAGYGSQNTWHLAAGAGGPINPVLSYRLDASYRRSDGYVDRGRSDSIALSGALRFAPTDSFAITLRDDYSDQRPMEYFGTPLIDGQLDTAIRERNFNVADASLHYRDNRTMLTATWSPTGAISITNTAYRLTSKRLFKDLESYCWVASSGYCPNGYNSEPEPAGRIYRTDNLGIVHDQKQYGDQGSIKVSTPLGGRFSNDLVVGFDLNLIKLTYSNDFGSDLQEDTVNPSGFDPGLFYDTQGIAPRYRTRTSEYAFFAEDRLKLGEQVSLVGGIRAEHGEVERWNISYGPGGTITETSAYPGGGSKTLHNITYRIGTVYQPTQAISLYGQYATGVDPLGTLTTYSTNASQFYFTNATGDQIEAGAKASFLDGRGSATLAAYRIVKKNLVAQRTPTSPVEQIGQRSSRGIEASLSFQLPAGFAIDANGTVLDARYDSFISGGTNYTGNTPANVPETAANLWVSWDSRDRLQARLGLRYVGRTFSDDANIFRVPAYAVVDGGVTYGLTKNVAIDVHVYNLLDKDYAITTYNDEQWILGRPRSVDVAVRVRL